MDSKDGAIFRAWQVVRGETTKLRFHRETIRTKRTIAALLQRERTGTRRNGPAQSGEGAESGLRRPARAGRLAVLRSGCGGKDMETVAQMLFLEHADNFGIAGDDLPGLADIADAGDGLLEAGGRSQPRSLDAECEDGGVELGEGPGGGAADVHSEASPDWFKKRMQAVESLRKELNDPATTQKQKADIADFELTLLDGDTKQLASALDQMEKELADIEKNEKSLEAAGAAASTKTEISHPCRPSTDTTSEIASFSGSNDKNTESFETTSSRWLVTWKSSPTDSGGGYFSADAVSDSDESNTQDIVSGVNGAKSDTTILEGAGKWHLKVRAVDTNWSVTITQIP